MKQTIRNLLLAGIMLAVAFSGLNAGSESKRPPLQKQAERWNEILKWRLDHLLPELMKKSGIDLWLVINREYNEDPVYMTLVPRPAFNARRTSILIFHYQKSQHRVDRYTGSYYPLKGWYKGIWKDKSVLQFDSLAGFIRRLDPSSIGINVSDHWAFGDGLSQGLAARLEKALGPEYWNRRVSAEKLCVGWLETRSPMELKDYPGIASVAHDLIREFFSPRVIRPGITRRDDVRWWIMERFYELGVDTWFFPSIDILRFEDTAGDDADPELIRPGDLLHCDVGIVCQGLCTDMQWNAYVCRKGEQNAPEGIREALEKAHRVARLFMSEFREGRNGSEVIRETMKKVRAEGIEALIYSHPVGFHGHAAGPPMEGRPAGQAPEGTRYRAEHPLRYGTVYAIEFSVYQRVPQWNNQKIRLGFEEMALFDRHGCRFIDGYQKELILIRPPDAH